MVVINDDLVDEIKRQARATWAAGNYDAAVDNIWAAWMAALPVPQATSSTSSPASRPPRSGVGSPVST